MINESDHASFRGIVPCIPKAHNITGTETPVARAGLSAPAKAANLCTVWNLAGKDDAVNLGPVPAQSADVRD